ncbi:MAG: ATP-dependent Clp protease adaptor ClpS [Bacteroidetes bacterium]|nr:ATP-dependent Clp protease adaptor ClpS [Bacteroidota bacterium]
MKAKKIISTKNKMVIKNFDKPEREGDTESDVLIVPEEVEVDGKQIILYNDDYNTFDFVIESLIKICKHDSIQAEQCTYLVHYKGKCSVKKGSYEDLEPICTALLEKGLTAEIE